MAVQLNQNSNPISLAGRYTILLHGGSATVQVSPLPDAQGNHTWIGLISITATAVTGNGVMFVAEIGRGLVVRVTGAGTATFAQIPSGVVNAA